MLAFTASLTTLATPACHDAQRGLADAASAAAAAGGERDDSAASEGRPAAVAEHGSTASTSLTPDAAFVVLDEVPDRDAPGAKKAMLDHARAVQSGTAQTAAASPPRRSAMGNGLNLGAAAYGGPPPSVGTRPLGPTGAVAVGAVTGAERVPNATRVVAGLRSGFRACYNAGLNVDPAMLGHVTLTVTVAPNGDVASVQSSTVVGLLDPVVACLTRKAKNAVFDSPGANEATLSIPLTFSPVKQ